MRSSLRAPFLTSAEAQLYVAGVEASCAFFTAKLGFSNEFVYGDPPFYAQVRRDNARLNLRLVSEPVFAGDIRERENLLSASITVGSAREIEQLFVDFEAAEVRFAQSLKREPWGAQTFIVIDPDGNLISFSGPAAEEAKPGG
jgi:catechol 2,3-dioxygenase-like lactoylglutathione lyase family enzyme